MSKTIGEWQSASYQQAAKSGWHGEGLEKTFPECLMMIVSELSEALESWRKGEEVSWVDLATGKPEGYGVELADAFIRLVDTCEQFGIDLEGLTELKHEYNKKRPWRHGNKKV